LRERLIAPHILSALNKNINGAQLIFVTLEGILIFVKLVHC